MKLQFNLALLITIMALFAGSLKAQTTQSFTPGQLKAAEKCLMTIGLDKQFEPIVDKIITTQSAQLPESNRTAFVNVMRVFMGKYFTWDALKDKLSQLYASEFTESELNQLTAFYNTSLGKKVSEKLPVLMQKGMLLGQQAVQEHRPELEQMMQEAFKNIDPPPVKEQIHE